MVLTPAPHQHELDNTIHATFLYSTARLHPFSMQLPAVQEGQSMPEAVLRQHGSWERTRRAPRPQPDGGDARRAMLPDHARYPLQGRAARVRCTTKSIAKKSTTGSLPPVVPLAITPTFSPWTHTSDDSYIYQLSLVSATATVSSISVISTLFSSLMLGVSHAVEVLVLVYWWCKIPYSSCIVHTAVVVACVIFIHSRCRGYGI